MMTFPSFRVAGVVRGVDEAAMDESQGRICGLERRPLDDRSAIEADGVSLAGAAAAE
jgi:hypothetical protein